MINEWTVFWAALFWIGTPLIASAKNRPWGGWLVLAILLGPIAFLIVIFVPKVEPHPATRCPWCKAGVPEDAVVCMYCTRDMTVAPEAGPATNTTIAEVQEQNPTCKYCGHQNPDVKGLFGSYYHRHCRQTALVP